jgi:bifunctional non-homologous end joining protein LigD
MLDDARLGSDNPKQRITTGLAAAIGRADIRHDCIEERRERLKRLVAGVESILFSEVIEVEGEVVFAKACALGLERIVSKRAGSLYGSGRARQWPKCKNPALQRT